MDFDVPEDDEERDMDLLQRHVSQLSMHFDTIQVFATRSHPDGTVNCHYGDGNWFARYGQVRTWLVKEEQSFRNMAPSGEDI